MENGRWSGWEKPRCEIANVAAPMIFTSSVSSAPFVNMNFLIKRKVL